MMKDAEDRPLVALTGATGFIGRHLLRSLPARGFRLRILLRRPSEVPPDCASAVIGDLAQPRNMAAALADVDAVVHAAGSAPTMSGHPEDDHRHMDDATTRAFARAAERAGVRRFVFLSSVRAQTGPFADRPLTDADPAAPSDSYGRGKVAAERALAETDLDWVALRLALVYGEGAPGNAGELLRLARSPWPLPLAGVRARRALLSLDNLAAAVETALRAPGPLRRPLLVADPEPLAAGEIVAALRRGLGRRPGLFPLPAPMLDLAFRLSGRAGAADRLLRPLVVDTSALAALGWRPAETSAEGLAAYAATAAAKERHATA